MKIQWAATCITCGKVLGKAPNGAEAEAAGIMHKNDEPQHSVWVGYEVETPIDGIWRV